MLILESLAEAEWDEKLGWSREDAPLKPVMVAGWAEVGTSGKETQQNSMVVCFGSVFLNQGQLDTPRDINGVWRLY